MTTINEQTIASIISKFDNVDNRTTEKFNTIIGETITLAAIQFYAEKRVSLAQALINALHAGKGRLCKTALREVIEFFPAYIGGGVEIIEVRKGPARVVIQGENNPPDGQLPWQDFIRQQRKANHDAERSNFKAMPAIEQATSVLDKAVKRLADVPADVLRQALEQIIQRRG